MKSFARLRPSPALAISLLALFVSLSGVSYGVATGFIDSREIRDNQVRTRDLRNNDIRTKDLRNNEVRGIDVRNSTIQGRDVAVATLTGEDVRESSLTEVPSATRAGTAAAVDPLRVIHTTTLSEGETPATLLQYGPLTVTAACLAEMGGPQAEVRVQSTETGSSADGEEASVPNLTTAPQAVAAVTSAGTREIESSPVVASAGGLAGLSGVMLLVADPLSGDQCRFQGHFVVSGVAAPG